MDLSNRYFALIWHDGLVILVSFDQCSLLLSLEKYFYELPIDSQRPNSNDCKLLRAILFIAFRSIVGFAKHLAVIYGCRAASTPCGDMVGIHFLQFIYASFDQCSLLLSLEKYFYELPIDCQYRCLNRYSWIFVVLCRSVNSFSFVLI